MTEYQGYKAGDYVIGCRDKDIHRIDGISSDSVTLCLMANNAITTLQPLSDLPNYYHILDKAYVERVYGVTRPKLSEAAESLKEFSKIAKEIIDTAITPDSIIKSQPPKLIPGEWYKSEYMSSPIKYHSMERGMVIHGSPMHPESLFTLESRLEASLIHLPNFHNDADKWAVWYKEKHNPFRGDTRFSSKEDAQAYVKKDIFLHPPFAITPFLQTWCYGGEGLD